MVLLTLYASTRAQLDLVEERTHPSCCASPLGYQASVRVSYTKPKVPTLHLPLGSPAPLWLLVALGKSIVFGGRWYCWLNCLYHTDFKK